MTTTNIQSFFGNVEVAGTLDVTGTLTSTTGVDKVSLAVDATNNLLPIIFSSGTAGSQSLKTDPGITYNPSTNVLAVTSNIGIGTSAPAYNLDVHGSSNVGTLKATTGTFSSNFAVNTDNFFVDTATGRVGVGLTNPGAPLVVEDQVNTTSVYNQGIMKLKRGPNGVGEDKLWIGFSHGSSSADNNDRARIGTHIKTGGLGEIFFTTGAGDGQAERMRITGTGNVGIGTSSPAYTLDVHGTSNVGALTATSATVPNDGDFVMSGKPLQPTAGLHWDKINSRLGVGMTSPQFAVDVDGIINAKGLYLDGSAYTVSPWKLNGNDVYYTTGNVGVGTANPLDKLHVYGAPMIQHDTRRNLATAAWYKIGTWDAAASDGARLKVSLLGGANYNANGRARGGETIIYASINNNSPTSVANIDGLVESHGKPVTTQVKFKQVGTDPTKYEIHAYIQAYTQHSMSVECSGTTTFTKEWVASSDPGVESATVSHAIFSTVVDNSGNVGIGTTAPTYKLDVHGTSNVGALTATSLSVAANTDNTGIIGRAKVGSVGHTDYAGFAHYDHGTTSNYALLQGPSGETLINSATGQKIHFRESNADKMVLSGGNVGIGTTSPNYKLDVAGTVAISSNLAVNTDDLFVDTATERVGVGTTSPQVLLDVAGSSNSGNSLQLRSGDSSSHTDSSQIIFSYNNNPYNSGGYAHSIRTRHNSGGDTGNAIDFWLWNTTDTADANTLGNKRVMTIEGTGNVGIGTTAPAYKLEVSGKVAVPSDGDFVMNSKPLTSATGLHWDTVNLRLGVGTASPSHKLHIYGASASALKIETDTGQAQVLLRAGATVRRACRIDFSRADTGTQYAWIIGDYQQNATDDLTLGTSGGGRIMTLTQGGNAGIGTTSPGTKLHIQGSSGELFRYTDGTRTVYGGCDANEPWFGTSTDNDLRLVTNGSEKVRIESGGNVGIGTASPAQKLDVAGTVAISSNLEVGTANLFVNAETGRVGVNRNNPLVELDVNGTISGTHLSLGTQNYPTIGGNWLSIFSPTFDGAIGDNHPDPDGGILFTNASSNGSFPWGYYMGVVKDVATTNPSSLRFDIGISNDIDTQNRTGGANTLTPYLTIDNGNVGIGTTTPAYKLEVSGKVAVPNDGDFVMGGKPLKPATGLHWDRTNSRLGVGTTSPAAKLDSRSGVGNGTTSWISGTFGGTGAYPRVVMGALSSVACIGAHSSALNAWEKIYLNNPSNSVVVDTAGRLGIGTASPAYTLDVNGSLRHTGLTMSSGGGVDQLKIISKTLQITVAWMDTGISATDLETGTHAVQIFNVDDHAVGGSNYDETYSGIMSWYSGITNSTEATEIHLTSAGHAPNNNHIYLRVLRSTSSSGLKCRLQIRRDIAMTGSYAYSFRFRRLI